MSLKIHTIPTKKDKIKQPELSKEDIIPRLNSSILFIGASGSGKTTLLANLLTRKDMFKKWFDRIFLISPTAHSDDIQKYLDIDPDDIIDDLKEAPSVLGEIMEDQRAEITTLGAHRAPMYAVIFDDVIGDKDLMSSEEFTKSFIASRHHNMTTMICSQSYKAIPRKCRLQAQNIFYFRGSNSETECIVEDRCPPGCNKKAGMEMVEFATKEPFSFLHINMRCPFETRYRRNLDEIIQISNGVQLLQDPTTRKKGRGREKHQSSDSGATEGAGVQQDQNGQGSFPNKRNKHNRPPG